jgi:hypothetical protein
MTILIALATLGGLTLALAGLLIVANRKLYVYEDPRIDTVEEMLPHANCGACGYPGCRPFCGGAGQRTGLYLVSVPSVRMTAAQPLQTSWAFPWEEKNGAWPGWLVREAAMLPGNVHYTGACLRARPPRWYLAVARDASGVVWDMATAKKSAISMPST